MNLESMYQEVILDHYRNPHGKGDLEVFDAEVHHVNPTCGDEVTVRVRVADNGSAFVEAMSHSGQGCSISQASASVLYDLSNEQQVEKIELIQLEFSKLMHSATSDVDASELDVDLLEDAIAFEGVAKYPARIKCALLPWMALRDAINQAHGSVDSDRATTLEAKNSESTEEI